MNIFKRFFIATISLSMQIALAEQSWTPELAKAKPAFEKETGVPLRAGHRIEPTVFPGYYAVRSGLPGAPSAYFREDMSWLGNVRTQGWTIRSPLENSPQGKITWLKEQLRHLPLDRLIFVRRKTPAAVVIWSAPDCPFCRKLERALEQEDVSAYVAPVGLTEEGYQQAAKIYCSSEPGRAWLTVMQGIEPSEATSPACSYPREMLNDIGFFFGMGRMATPIVIFADGTTLKGWDDQRDRAVLREKIKQKVFYASAGD